MASKIAKLGNKVKTIVADNLQNVLTGLGIQGMDKSMSSEFVNIRLSYAELEDAYTSDWLVGKVCDLPPFDMTRAWRQMDGDMAPEKLEVWEEFEARLQIRTKFKEAMVYARIYGGSGIVLNVDDGNEPWEPLEIDKIKQGSLNFLIVSDQQYLHMGQLDYNPLSENYGYPLTYRLAPSSTEIHYTRILRFEGIALPLQPRRKNRYWGKSLIERLYKALIHAAEVQENIGALIHEATVDVISIPDLMSMIANPDTEELLQKRFGVAKIQKSINRMLLLDADEEYTQHSQTFTGLTDLIEKYLDIVAGAADIPITRLFGQSPGGLSSTGESDLRNYYDHLSARQETELRPRLMYLDRIIYQSLFGTVPAKGELDFTFNSLWQMSDQETATLENDRSTRDSTYLGMNVINEAIIARDLMEKGTYSGVDADYVKELEAIVAEAETDLGGDDAEGEDDEDDEEETDEANADSSDDDEESSET